MLITQTNHTPATPLPFAANYSETPYCVQLTARGAQDLVADVCMLNGINYADSMQNAAYLAHAANAYPRLVQAMSMIATLPRDGNIPQQVVRMQRIARTILRELGEE